MSESYALREASLPADAEGWGHMRRALWPDEEVASEQSLRDALQPESESCVLLAVSSAREVIGFAEAKLRGDYVNGTQSTPVGFLEGWYVDQAWRGRGIGRALVKGIEQWTLAKGCAELASDVRLDNPIAQAAHARCGFEETERVVYFCKRLEI